MFCALLSTQDSRLEAYARLVVRVGVNLQAGQTLAVSAGPEHAPLAAALAREAYAAGARFVDVVYLDPHVRRAHIEFSSEDDLGYSPPWLVTRLRQVGERHDALIAIEGEAEPELFGISTAGESRGRGCSSWPRRRCT